MSAETLTEPGLLAVSTPLPAAPSVRLMRKVLVALPPLPSAAVSRMSMYGVPPGGVPASLSCVPSQLIQAGSGSPLVWVGVTLRRSPSTSVKMSLGRVMPAWTSARVLSPTGLASTGASLSGSRL